MEGQVFPEAPYDLANLFNLTHTPPVVETNENEITPFSRSLVFAVPELWCHVWEFWANAVRAAPFMVNSNP